LHQSPLQKRTEWLKSHTDELHGWIRGSLHINQFLTRLEKLGVNNKNARELIWKQTVQKTLSMLDMILKFFFAAVHSIIDRAIYSLPKKITQKSTGKFKLFLRSTGPPEGKVG